MAILVAVTDSEEGDLALTRAVEEAELRRTPLLVANLRLSPLEAPADAKVLERPPNTDVADYVLALLDQHAGEVDLLVIGMKRRSPVGKALLGSVAQHLLLSANVPVLAVKTAD
ncbi:universal stress protein [Amycolatopsis balhimycina DSM 5908]|uniref:Universal stress protein n=1 Tax=Amycolatopsis balhimycina DSM 5908 TaxID=1081091 RepID=A0A428WJF8_AMYBA|nr:universal stress protein [Amycolatopsis balhimycina]RSM43193.1 universal stress protein [Amycolatopsis balhimycina DSM 5908]